MAYRKLDGTNTRNGKLKYPTWREHKSAVIFAKSH
jgi:hypothetical protein